ncbi:MAG: hypothetical protein EBT03_09710 [Betaproteobacteria bacterium]|nr:hypothetical protein [Betaproteobacteria bacterium]NCA17517.1 hypothetical protein [Betaproteobacteria bacterium]
MTKSSTTSDFWSAYRSLPPDIKRRTRAAYRLWRRDPRHPSLRFKKCGQVWSVRVGAGYRALAMLQEDTFYWYWIGGHDEYERFLSE